MQKKMIAGALALALSSFAQASFADERLVSFDGGIGVIPFAGINTSVTPNAPALNVVRDVPPGGQPWVIERLSADVRSDGRITVDGRGLLLAGGNGIGTTGGQSVLAALFCGGVRFDSQVAVPLEPNGDFRIASQLDGVPPHPCASPVLLVISSNLGRWFAAGIPKQ